MATRHVGPREYFKELDGVIRDFERNDHWVLYGAVTGLTPDLALTPNERRIPHELDLMEREQRHWVERRRFVRQENHLTPESSRLRADIWGRDLFRRMAEARGFVWSKARRVILEYRDSLLIQAIQAWEDRDLVIVFGVGYFKAIERYLTEKGYEVADEQWLVAHSVWW